MMAKSARSSTRKANNQRLKKNVFGPVELARAERLSAKLLELASQPKAEPERKDEDMAVDDAQEHVTTDEPKADATTMEVDSETKPPAPKKNNRRIEKRRKRKASITFARVTKAKAKGKQ